MTKIKYWIYYLRDGTDNEIYAYTDNKEYAELFELDRNMSMFTCIKKKIGIDEINFLAREYQNCYLKEMKMRIFDKSKSKWINAVYITTVSEYLTVTTASISLIESDIYEHCWYNPGIFKKNIFKALEVIEYNNVYRQITSNVYDDNETEINIKPDMLGIFLYYYGKTMRGE